MTGHRNAKMIAARRRIEAIGEFEDQPNFSRAQLIDELRLARAEAKYARRFYDWMKKLLRVMVVPNFGVLTLREFREMENGVENFEIMLAARSTSPALTRDAVGLTSGPAGDES